MKRKSFGDLTQYIGQKYGNWLILDIGEDKVEKSGATRKTFKCKCECGYCNEEVRDVIAKNLLNNRSKGCGKLSRILNGKSNKRYNEFKHKGEYIVGYTYLKEEFKFDVEDFDNVKNIYWRKHSEDGYLRGQDSSGGFVFMHNIIMNNTPGEFVVDHINGDTFDNRKVNLRICSRKDNMKNLKKYSNNKSGHKGVHWAKNENKWKAYIYVEKKRMHLGTFSNIEDAISIRKIAEYKYFGEFNREEMYL